MKRRVGLFSRLIGGVALMVAGAASFAPAAHAQSGDSTPSSGGSGTQVVGETVTSEAIGAQFAFNIPGLIPLPDENIIELDGAFARSIVSSGPDVQSIGAPYYPGDILGNLGGLESEFVPTSLGPLGLCPLGSTPSPPSCTFPVAGNWPFMAESEYPATPAYGSSATFSPTCSDIPSTPCQSLPSSAPDGLSGTSTADNSGGGANGTISDMIVGPGMGQNGAALLEVASEQSNEAVNIASSLVTATASSVVKAIDIAGMVDITELSSDAQSTSDGTTGSPTSTVHLGQVTVDGQPAYIDNQGVHVVGTNPAPAGAPTASQLQSSLDAAFSEDGISVALVTPQDTTNGPEGIANTGGLVISFSHSFNVPFANTGELTAPLPCTSLASVPFGSTACPLTPCVPTQAVGNNPVSSNIPGLAGQEVLGDVCVPAGNYTAVTSVTLGLATADVNASGLQSLGSSPLGLGSSGLGGLGASTSGLTALGSQTSLGSVSGPGSSCSGCSTSTKPFGAILTHFPIRGIPAPVGWVALGLILCVLFAYPMMLTARWQFLVGRR